MRTATATAPRAAGARRAVGRAPGAGGLGLHTILLDAINPKRMYIAISAAGLLIRMYFVARHKRHERGGRTSPWAALLGLMILAATAAALAPKTMSWLVPGNSPALEFAAVQRIVSARCIPCHAAAPTQPGFSTAPQGLKLDTPEGILTHAAAMGAQVQVGAMPIGNVTGMTDAERKQLLDWIRDGARH